MKRSAGERTKIFLIGYRACGKSVVGKLLASRLDLEFLDMDREITRREGMSIKEMVTTHGWDYFRQRERELLRELSRPRATQAFTGEADRSCPAGPTAASHQPGWVIATGGGAVLQEDLWPAIKASWPVIWLTADAATIAKRISADAVSDQQRPALTSQGQLTEIAEVLQQRQRLYQQAANLEIDTTAADPTAIVERIIDCLQSNHETTKPPLKKVNEIAKSP